MYRLKIKVGFHTFAFISAWWTLFSLFGIFDFIDSRRHSKPLFDLDALPDYVIWGLHILFMACAFYCFVREKPRETIAVQGSEISKVAHYTALTFFLANLPVFAWWHGGDITLHILIHTALIGLGVAALRVKQGLKPRGIMPNNDN